MTAIRYGALAAVLTMAAMPAGAFQLGPMEVRSVFGEPLEAYIRIADSARLRPRDMALDFFSYRNQTRMLKPDRVLVFSRLRYEIVKSGRNEDLGIRLFTNEPLQEARIGFRLRLTNRNQFRRVADSRSYLHILPGTLVEGSDGAVKDRRFDRRTLEKRRGHSWQLGIAAPQHNLYVSSNDYEALWIMAQQLKSGYGISAFQAMLAIFDINRHAFGVDSRGKKNINFLWANKELRMPTLDEMRSYDRPSSVVEVAIQNFYSGMTLPIYEPAVRDLITIDGGQVADLGGEAEPYSGVPQFAPEDVPVGAEPGAVETPVTDIAELMDITEDLPASEERGWLLYLSLIVALVLAILVIWMLRSRQASSGPDNVALLRANEIQNQMDMLRAHVDMGDADNAGIIYSRLTNQRLSPEERSQADDLMQRLDGDADSNPNN